MTAGEAGPEEQPPAPLAAAENDLARVREVLEHAARGEAGASELKATVEGYLEDHGAALHDAAAALAEEARLKTLQELYKWRAQLDAQLKAPKRGD